MNLEKLNKRDYPKLQEERILTVNKTASLGAFAKKSDKLAQKYRQALGAEKYVPRIRDEHEALPRTGDWRKGDYDPKAPQACVGLARYS